MSKALQHLVLISLMGLSGLSAAQTAPVKAPAKPPAKAAVKAPAAKSEKLAPGEKLMSRDELRACFKRTEGHKTESESIDLANKALELDRGQVVEAGKALRDREDANEVAFKSITAEQAELKQRADVLNVELPKMAKKERAEAAAVYDASAAAVNARVDGFNEVRKVLKADRLAHEQKVEDFNRRKAELELRIDGLGDKQDLWRKECGNRPYEESDEKAVRKQLAAEKAAEKTAEKAAGK